MHLFGGHQRKTLFQIKPKLGSEKTQSPGTGAVFFLSAFIQNFLHQIEVGSHDEITLHRETQIAKSKLLC